MFLHFIASGVKVSTDFRPYPQVTLAKKAREKRNAARKLLVSGITALLLMPVLKEGVQEAQRRAGGMYMEARMETCSGGQIIWAA